MFRCARAAMGGLVVLALVVTGSTTAIAADPDPVLTPGQNLAVELPDGASADFHPVDPAASGGQVQAVQLDVHGATAVSADGTVSALGDGVQISAKAPDGTGLTSFEHDVTVQPATEDTPAYVSSFVPGVELTFPVSAEQLAGVDPATLGIWSRESAAEKWIWVPSAYDPKLGAVVAQSDHLSEFALMAAPAAATTGPRIALDPDDNLGHALWNGTVYGELPLSYDVATQVKAKLESECGADVLITRDASTAFVSRTTRANLIKAQNADIALTLAFNTYNSVPGEDYASPWGVQTDGGVRAWSNAGAQSVSFGNKFRTNIPTYTGRPSRLPLNPDNAVLPYSAFAGVAGTYAHAELLFLDHNYDWPVIHQQLGLVVDAVYASIIQQIEATPGLACVQPVTLPAPPSAAEIQRLRDLGRNNYQRYGTDPVNLSTGNFTASEDVFALTGVGDQKIDLTLAYNALDGRLSPVGSGWNFAYSSRAQQYADGSVLATLADGRSVYFASDGAGGFVTPPGARTALTAIEGGVRLTFGDSTTLDFTVDPVSGYGTLSRAVDRQGNATTLTYGPLAKAGQGQIVFAPLTSITDEAGQSVAVTSAPDGRITGFTHPDGRTWTLMYDAASHLTGVTDGAGRTRHFSYNDTGLLAVVTGADGVAEVTNTYDAAQHVVTQVDGAGHQRTIAYGADGATTLTDALGNSSVLQHNDKGQLAAEHDPLGGVTRTEYDANFNPVRSVDANGNAYVSTFDAFGRVLTATNPLGETTTYTYNAAGDLTSTSAPAPDGSAATTTFVLNTDGRATETHLPDGTVTYASYDAHGDVTSVTDAAGTTTRFTYDARGNTVSTTDALGAVTRSTFDLANRVTSTTDPAGGVSALVWDAADNLVRSTDPAGGVTVYAYDANDSRVSMTDPLGAVTTYEHNVNLQVTAENRPDGTRVQYRYDAENRKVEQINPDGTTVRWEYDGLGRQSAKVDEAGQRWLTEYDAIGNPVATVDPTGARTAVEFDPLGRAVAVTDALGNRTQTTYNPAGLAAAKTDALGRSTRFDYDVMGRTSSVTAPDGGATTYGYDSNGNLVSVADPRGAVTTFEFDALGRQTAKVDALGGRTRNEYDALGNVVATVDPLGARTETRVDALSRPVATVDALGGTTATTYNAIGDVTAKQDALGRVTAYQRDAMGRMTRESAPDGTVTQYRYNANGDLVAEQDPRGLTTAYELDALRRVTARTDKAGQRWLTEYDARGNTVATVDPLGARTETHYDAVSQPVATIDALGGRTQRRFDAAGSLVTQMDARGNTTTITRDVMGRPSVVAAPDGGITRNTYDAAGNLVSTVNPRGFTTTQEFDALGRATAKVDAAGGRSHTEYDAVGNVVATVDAAGARTVTRYDALSRPVATVDALGGVATKTYDPVGAVTAETDALGRVTSHAYDAMGRAVATVRPDGGSLAFAYNANGELVSQTDARGFATAYTVDPLGRVTTRTDKVGQQWRTEYDAVGNAVAAVDPTGARTVTVFDALSHPVAGVDALGGRTQSAYDALGAVTARTDQLGRVTSFTFDVMGRLSSATTPGGAVTRYAHDVGGNVTSVTNPLGDVLATQFDALDRPAVQVAPDGGRTVTAYNAVGRVTSVTDANGASVSQAYDALGRLVRRTDGGGFASSFTFDAVGNTLTQTDPRGGLTRFEHDALDRKVKVTDAVGGIVSTGYDGGGNVVSGTNAAGVVTTHGYDARGLLTATVENTRVGVAASASTNVTTTVDYDSRGLQAQVTDPRGNATRYAHDALGRLTGETDALGQATTTVFDAAGQRTSVTAGDGSTTSFEYTADGYVARVTYPDKDVVSTFDALGRRVSMKDPVGVSAWVYDWAGRVTSESDALGKTTGHTFDLVGNAVGTTYPDGRVVSRVFDGRGLATKQADGSGATSLGYDAAGALVGEVRASGVSTSITRDLLGRVRSIVHSGHGVVSSSLPSGEVNPSSAAPGNAFGHCKDNGGGHPNQAPAGCTTSALVFAYTYDPRGLVATRDVSTDGVTTSTAYTHDALGRLTGSATGSLVSGYSWDASSNLIGEQVSDDSSTPVGGDGYTTQRSVNAVNQVTSVVEDPFQLPSVHTTTTGYSYDARGNRTSQVTTRATGGATHVLGKVTNTFDGMDLLVSTTDAGSNLNSAKDDSTTAWVRDGLGRALTVSVNGATRQRTYDGLAVVSDGATALTRDPSGGVLTEATTKTVLTGKTASTVTNTVDVLTDVLGSTVSVATAGVISADLAVFTDFGQPLTTPKWDTVTGFTGQVDTSGLLEFASRTYDPASRTWLQDDSYRGTAARSASLNRYTYVEGAPETFVDALGFHRAAAALQAQLLAAKKAAEAAKAQAAQLLFMRTPTCTGYYGCYTRELYQQTLQRNYNAARSAGAYQSGFVGIGGVCSGAAACEGIRRGKSTVVLDDVTYPLPTGVTRGQLEDSCENDYVCMAKGVGLIQSGLPDTASRIFWGAAGGVADSIQALPHLPQTVSQQYDENGLLGAVNVFNPVLGLMNGWTGVYDGVLNNDPEKIGRNLVIYASSAYALKVVVNIGLKAVPTTPEVIAAAPKPLGPPSGAQFVVNSAGEVLDATRVTIPQGKLGYLLKDASKAGVFQDSMGFGDASLDAALRQHLVNNFAKASESVPMTGGGTKFTVRGSMTGPSGQAWEITTVWGVDPSGVVRLITATP